MNNEECEELSKHQEDSEYKEDSEYNENSEYKEDSEYEEESEPVKWNKENELCAGKKHQIPKPAISFKRIKKEYGKREEEEEKAKECKNYNIITL